MLFTELSFIPGQTGDFVRGHGSDLGFDPDDECCLPGAADLGPFLADDHSVVQIVGIDDFPDSDRFADLVDGLLVAIDCS